MLIADEAHYIKNPEAQRTINTKRLCESAERLLFMTGTALENRVDEMISLIEILNPKVAFSLRGLEFLSAAPMFRERAAAVYYRRKREDVLTELPELIESREWCSLTLEETALYEQAILARKVNDARRVSFNVQDVRRSSKAKRLFELVEEARDEGRKVVVFSFFLDTIQKVQELLDYRCLPAITGAMSSEERQQVIDTFEESAAGTVLPAQISAGGTGLNIQTASVVVICEPQLKPSSENQAISRVYRMGQTRNVLVYRLLAEDTIDEKLLNLLAGKQELFDALADKSAAAEAEVDAGNVGRIVEEEIERIKRASGDGP
jgi:SNF2 family DNA or RNA helicase